MGLRALGEIMTHVRPVEIFHLGPIPIYSTVVNTWIIMILLLAGIFLATRKLSFIPRGAQHVLEMFLEFFYGLLEEIIGKEGRRYLPLVATLFIFILSLNLSWFIPGMKPPTMDLSTTAAFAVTTIILVQIFGIRKLGLRGYIRHFFQPAPFLFPLNVIEELVKPVSLSLRLFGNLFGEEMVVTILFLMIPFLLPTPIMLLGVLMGTIQAFVFTLLTITYIANFVHGH
ncbi:F0F1 ATP synthase subunit A [Neomoorella thermoacetica]|nr:F0F1 ATP synthase subunit A [Moorella thermoacetica]AAB51460.1 ATP synthase subunit a [Moorella thermoacetica]AKX97867.1 ATP synthase subunit a [Moorella thermoacetica]APC09580.1 ATP synthase subunit a [Moorella thermoacetica]OIQ10046.1 ATP synthase subunit a [Moorella thermoacetica]OIQ54143.1 ATP synthase subunit a [Moorella thermoacetica]